MNLGAELVRIKASGRWLPGALWLVLSLASAAAHPADDLAWSAPVAVAQVPAGNLLRLADGRAVRLAGIRIPSGPAADAVAERARAALERLVRENEVRLAPAEAAYDRYGRLVAQVERTDGLWLQGTLLEQGLAQVQTRPGEVLRASEMLDLEHAAREAKLGLWAEPTLGPCPVDQARRHVGSFQIVQGRVARVAPTRSFVYLNFGADWRRDFTLRLPLELKELFARSGLDPQILAGRRIEVRGFVLWAGGPLIELSHPEQLQLMP